MYKVNFNRLLLGDLFVEHVGNGNTTVTENGLVVVGIDGRKWVDYSDQRTPGRLLRLDFDNDGGGHRNIPTRSTHKCMCVKSTKLNKVDNYITAHYGW